MTVESAAKQLYQQQDLRDSVGEDPSYARSRSVGAYPYSKLKHESTYPYTGISFPGETKMERSSSAVTTGEATSFSSVLQGPFGEMSGQAQSEEGQSEEPYVGLPRSYRPTKGSRDGVPGPRSQGSGRPYSAPTQRNLPPAPPARGPQGGRPVGPRSYNSDVMTYEGNRPSRRPGDAKAPYDSYDRPPAPASVQTRRGQRTAEFSPFLEVIQPSDLGPGPYGTKGGATEGSLALDTNDQAQGAPSLATTKTSRPTPMRPLQTNLDEGMLDGLGNVYESYYADAKNEGEEESQVATPSSGPRSSRLASPMVPSQTQGSAAFSDAVEPGHTSLVQQNRQIIRQSIHDSIDQIPKAGGDEFTLQAQVKYEQLKEGLATITSFFEPTRDRKEISDTLKNPQKFAALSNQVKSLPGLVDDIYDMAGMIVKNEQSLRTENQMALDAYTNSVIDTLAKVTAEKTGLAMTDQLIAEGKAACRSVLQSTMGLTNGLASESQALVDRYKALDASMSALDGSLKRCAQDLNQFLVTLQSLQHRLATYESSAQETLDTLYYQNKRP